MEILKVPTAVAAFDSIIKGGVPEGSVVLLIGEPGAGNWEFSVTSAAKLSIARKYPERRGAMLGGYLDEIYIPGKTCYISMTKSEMEVRRMIEISLEKDLSEALFEKFLLKDLSSLYFKKSFIPKSWSSTGSLFDQSESKDILEEIVKFLNDNGNDSIVIIDSLTDLLTSPQVNESALMDVIKGLVKVSKKWNTILYLLLTEGIADKRMEQMISDIVDGILSFRWYSSEKYSARYRYLYVPKFIGVLPHIEEERVIRFKTQVDYTNGFVVTYTEKIR